MTARAPVSIARRGPVTRRVAGNARAGARFRQPWPLSSKTCWLLIRPKDKGLQVGQQLFPVQEEGVMLVHALQRPFHQPGGQGVFIADIDHQTLGRRSAFKPSCSKAPRMAAAPVSMTRAWGQVSRTACIRVK